MSLWRTYGGYARRSSTAEMNCFFLVYYNAAERATDPNNSRIRYASLCQDAQEFAFKFR